jgi:hypothetical protein
VGLVEGVHVVGQLDEPKEVPVLALYQHLHSGSSPAFEIDNILGPAEETDQQDVYLS